MIICSMNMYMRTYDMSGLDTWRPWMHMSRRIWCAHVPLAPFITYISMVTVAFLV